MSDADAGAILTLEPLIEAIQEGVEARGWTLSGLQKTTSHQFEGRWEGESTRSAYLFFHPTHEPEDVSVDVYLDETSRGLAGNLALVVDLVPFGRLGNAGLALSALRAASERELDARFRRPLTLRFRLADAGDDPADAETEVRFKVRIPKHAMDAGVPAVAAFAAEALEAFARLLAASELSRYTADEDVDTG